MNKAFDGLTLSDDDDVNSTPQAPDWLRSPATVKPITSLEDFNIRANEYFALCIDDEQRATITGLALATGLPGPTSLIRLGQRAPELRFAISRCMTAVAHGYEQMIGFGNSAGPVFMLKNIPDFDPEDPDGAPGVQFFNDKKELLLQMDVSGAASVGQDYDGDEDPLDVYLSVIKKPGRPTQTAIESGAKTVSSGSRLFNIISKVD